jgi:hypothetical protein
MSVQDGLRKYYTNFGLRGVLAIAAYRLFKLPKQIIAHPLGVRNPVHIRVRTTDASVYAEVLLRQAYAFDLPFSPRTIVDAGANIGMASIYFTHRYPEAKVIASRSGGVELRCARQKRSVLSGDRPGPRCPLDSGWRDQCS